MSLKGNVTSPSPAHLKLLLRGLPETFDLEQCLQAMALKSLYTYYNPKQQTGWVALSPAPSESDLLPICQQLMNATQSLSIEKAPLQKIPRSHSRRDLSVNSIEVDPHYVKFLDSRTEDGAMKPVAKPAVEVEKIPTTVAPIVSFLASREKIPKGQTYSGPSTAEASNRAARRKKPKKKKERKKKTDSPDSASSVPRAFNSTNNVKPTEPVSFGVKILTKTSSQPNIRWQIKQSSSHSQG